MPSANNNNNKPKLHIISPESDVEYFSRQSEPSLSKLPAPENVIAIGRNECAAVLWTFTHHMVEPIAVHDDDVHEYCGEIETSLPVLDWEVTRYRLDVHGDWTRKGSTIIPTGSNLVRIQCLITGLKNGSIYRFTVKARSAKDKGSESAPSNMVLVEPQLPSGWTRHWDERSQKFYYSNLKTLKSSWPRPDDDPYFLEEDVQLLFTPAELKHLRVFFDAEMDKFGSISMRRLALFLTATGEDISMSALERIWREVLSAGTGELPALHTYKSFVILVQSIHWHVTRFQRASNLRLLSANFSRQLQLRLYRGSRTSFRKSKFGNWEERWSELAARCFYRDRITGDVVWEMPDDIRFFLPPGLKVRLTKRLGVQELERLKSSFAELDPEGTGSIPAYLLPALASKRRCNYEGEILARDVRLKYLSTYGRKLEFDSCCIEVLILRQNGSVSEDGGCIDGNIPDSAVVGGGDNSLPFLSRFLRFIGFNAQQKIHISSGPNYQADVEHGKHCFCGCRRPLRTHYSD